MSAEGRPVAIRDAVAGDCAAMAAIYAESLAARDCSMETETSEDRFLASLAGQGERECHLVLEQRGTVLGYGVIKQYSPRIGYRVACETSIYLSRKHTGTGLGSALQTALLDRCRAYGYHHVTARIWAGNEASLRFHQRFGFETIRIQKEIGFLHGAWHDVALMQLVLVDVPPFRPNLA